MRNDSLIDLLCCLTCRGSLRVQRTGEIASDGHLMAGELKCMECDAVYPIRGGIPRFVPPSLAADVANTIDGFAYEWKYANPLIWNKRFTSAETFLDFIHPLPPAYFKDKIVLDAGCGSGRFTYWAHHFGTSAVVGVDLSESVGVAFENTRSLSHVLIVQADLLSLPLRSSFDYAFSVGVLHHTAEPRRAFDALVERVKPGHGISAWVYGRENNGWIIHCLNPIRQHVTKRLPRRCLLALCYLLTAGMFVVLKGIYRPIGKTARFHRLKKYLFYFDYLYFLSGFGFHEQASIVFDHLAPAIAEYISRQEFTKWFNENGLESVEITSRAGNSWRGFGIRKVVCSAQASFPLTKVG